MVHDRRRHLPCSGLHSARRIRTWRSGRWRASLRRRSAAREAARAAPTSPLRCASFAALPPPAPTRAAGVRVIAAPAFHPACPAARSSRRQPRGPCACWARSHCRAAKRRLPRRREATAKAAEKAAAAVWARERRRTAPFCPRYQRARRQPRGRPREWQPARAAACHRAFHRAVCAVGARSLLWQLLPEPGGPSRTTSSAPRPARATAQARAIGRAAEPSQLLRRAAGAGGRPRAAPCPAQVQRAPPFSRQSEEGTGLSTLASL